MLVTHTRKSERKKLEDRAIALASFSLLNIEIGFNVNYLLDALGAVDGESLSRLMSRVAALGCQVIATSLDQNLQIFPEAPTVFHVKHGELSRAG